MIEFVIDDTLVPEAHRLSPAHIARIGEALAEHLPEARGTVEVNFVSDQEIQRLNRMYRQKDAVTDVLSFASGVPINGVLGDVIIGFDQAKRQGGEDLELELVDLLVHGTLHILGYDHERPEDAQRMFPLQDAIAKEALG